MRFAPPSSAGNYRKEDRMGVFKEVNRLATRVVATVVRTVEDAAETMGLIREDTKPKGGKD